jgi:hypothetical protein
VRFRNDVSNIPFTHLALIPAIVWLNYLWQLLIAQKPYDIHLTAFSTNTMFYSLAQKRPVAFAESVCVWYDYEKLGKAHGPEEMQAWLKKAEHPTT